MFILKDNFTGDFLSTPAEAAQDTSGLTNAEWVEITPSNKEAVNAYLKSKGLPDVDNIGRAGHFRSYKCRVGGNYPQQ
jgi:hypothetical protein